MDEHGGIILTMEPQIAKSKKEDLSATTYLENDGANFLNHQKKFGEIYLDTNAEFVILCTFCSKLYSNYEDFLGHIKMDHIVFVSQDDVHSFNSDQKVDIMNDMSLQYVTNKVNALETCFDNADEKSEIVSEIDNEDILTASNYLKLEIKIDDDTTSDQDSKKKKKIGKKQNQNDKNDILFKCSFCELVFNKQDEVVYHEYSHTNSNLFKCSICSQTFARGFELGTHIKTHGCSDNKKRIKNKYSKHVEDMSLRCSYCPKTFKYRKSQIHHEEIHKDDSKSINLGSEKTQKESPCTKIRKREFVKCDLCEKKFCSELVMKEHRSKH